MGQSRKAEFQAEEVVERMMVPEQEICIRWYFRQVNLKAIYLERQLGEAGSVASNTGGKKLTQEVARQSL